MKRKDFLKNLSAGIAAGIIVPQTLKASPINKEDNARVAVDVNSISHFHGATPLDILNLYKETGVLVYNSNNGYPPQVISGEIKVIDLKNKNPLRWQTNTIEEHTDNKPLKHPWFYTLKKDNK